MLTSVYTEEQSKSPHDADYLIGHDVQPDDRHEEGTRYQDYLHPPVRWPFGSQQEKQERGGDDC